MKVATAAQMRAIDQQCIENAGIPGVVLMETAGEALAQACIEELGSDAIGKRIAIFCGNGNNGGDGFVAARRLANARARVTIFLAGTPDKLKGDARIHFAPLKISDVRIIPVSDSAFERAVMEPFDLICDALLGTGARSPLGGSIGLLITHLVEMAEGGVPVISADIPSGVDADTGKLVDFVAAPAKRTVTFALPKPGLLLYPGASYAGRITVADIGIPRALLADNSELTQEITTQELLRTWLPERKQNRDANKGSFGTVLVIAGSAGMMGAAALTAVAALRAGAGLVMLAVPHSLLDTAAALAPEVILRTLPETPERTHGGPDALETALALADKVDAIAMGPGMSGNPAVASFVQPFVRRVVKPIVVDADGLNALTSSLTSVRYRGATPTVLTPHPGEMSRLLGITNQEVQSDRIGAVTRCAATFKAVTLLKGARTLVATPEGKLSYNRTGSPASATAGSGDVLTGIIAAYLAQELSADNAARAGAYIHALAGEIAAEELGTAGVIASDICYNIPRARQRLYERDDLDDL
jgi:NAD(P)H-hydrate epimerase